MAPKVKGSGIVRRTLANEDHQVQFRLAHLNMLQGVIGRMSSYSSVAKNFSVTILAASIALAFDGGTQVPLWIAGGAVLMFAIMDAYYLALERGFRGTYERVELEPMTWAGDLQITPERVPLLSAIRSVSIWPFYLVQMGAVGALLILGELG